MSKSWIKGLKKAKAEVEAIPRTQEDIRKSHSELCMKLGHARYQVKFFEGAVESILAALTDLDAEAGARKRLDEETAKTQQEPVSGAV